MKKSEASENSMSNLNVEAIRNFLPLSDRIGTAGQPAADQFAAIRQAGYDVVINLRPPAPDAPPDERALVEAEGMTYIHIPVIWDAPTQEDAQRFFAAMEANAEKKVFVHCAVNMRVSAFLFLYRTIYQKVAPYAAANDLHRIWTPDGHWKEFIQAVLDRHSAGPESGS